ncbi:Transcriptional regulator, TetR family [Alloactinosynnema sp. L-07]|uniref:TetR/AcrR family transcriptional regulator n=1 Tax=Alloactinosynnema sp. L-07 TaxID=1653480 RepID=UPI00065EF5ED|nr:TetR/AcrR family transcriptional regulator [Alloactinosynnema sp. L-07]CRK55925.1 Transcriptional regulator, TetR family [Alloactinosynnema sp. L-07]
MGRTSTARERLVDAACDLMHARGYAALGVAEICATADVRKGSFYHFFDSKQALTVAAIETSWTRQRPVWTAALAADVAPLDRIRRVLESQVDTQRAEKKSLGVLRGCLFGNLAQELGNQDDLVAGHLTAVFDDQITLVSEALAAAEAEDAIPAGTGTQETARAVLAQLEGMVLFAKLANDPALLDRLWPNTMLLLGAR